MLSVTFADLEYRYRQFLIAVLGAGVVLAMALLLSGLAAGFRQEVHVTLGGVGADRWVLPLGAQGRITSGQVIPQTDVSVLQNTAGVTKADPILLLPQQVAQVGGKSETVVIVGVAIGGLGDPRTHAGVTLSRAGQAIVDSALPANIGQTISVGPDQLSVVGRVGNRTLFGGVPVIYMPIADAQASTLSGRPLITAVVTKGVPAAVPTGLDAVANNVAQQRTLAVLSGAMASINNSKSLMYLVAAIIVAALLYVSALQRVRDFAVLKALGSSSRALFFSLALQSVVVTLAAAGFAAVVCNFMHGLFSQPVAIPASAFATLPLVAVGVGILSSLVALRRATGADPAAAFAG